MSSLAVQMELALHDVDCLGHGPDFEGHGDKYAKLAAAAIALYPTDREPWWLTDRKLIQENSLNIIMSKLDQIERNTNVSS